MKPVDAGTGTGRGAVYFTGFLTAVTGLLFLATLGLSPVGRLAPIWVVVPTAGLLLVELVREVRQVRSRLDDEAEGEPTPAGLPGTEGRLSRMAAWGVVLIVLVWVLGFIAAAPVFVAAYLRLEARLPWSRALLLSAVVAALSFLVFDGLLELTLPIGLLGW